MPSKAKITIGMPSREKVREIHKKARVQKKRISQIVLEHFNKLPSE